MTDRLSELVRQRALVSEHLAWIDQEIAREKNGAAPPSLPALPIMPEVGGPELVPASAPPLSPENRRAAPAANSEPTAGSAASTQPAVADELLEQYRVSPATVHQDVRKGCLLYFAGAFVVLGIVIAILYFTIGTR